MEKAPGRQKGQSNIFLSRIIPELNPLWEHFTCINHREPSVFRDLQQDPALKSCQLGHYSPVAHRYCQSAGCRMIASIWLIRCNFLVSRLESSNPPASQKQQCRRLMLISNRCQQRTGVTKPHDTTCFDLWLLRKILSGNSVVRKFTPHMLSHWLGCCAAVWKGHTFPSWEVFIVHGRKSAFSVTALTWRNCFTMKQAPRHCGHTLSLMFGMKGHKHSVECPDNLTC